MISILRSSSHVKGVTAFGLQVSFGPYLILFALFQATRKCVTEYMNKALNQETVLSVFFL